MYDNLIIGVRAEPGYVIITAAGEIDIFTVARLHEELFTLAGDGRPLIADLDRVIFLGAAGLGALAGAARRAAARGASLHVVCARPQSRQLLQLTGLDRTLRLPPHPGPSDPGSARRPGPGRPGRPAAAARPGSDRR